MDLYGENSFVCPTCSVLAQQEWYQVVPREERRVNEYGFGETVNFYTVDDNVKVYYLEGEMLKEPNVLAFCQCQSCKKYSLWYDHELVYPFKNTVEDPNPFMPSEVKVIYNEARAVLNISPRSSAALLRLGLEMLLPHLGAKKENINEMIKQLVRERKVIGKLQQAMDTLRVVGNDAVHPRKIDLEGRDNKDVSLALFKIINFIVAETLESDETISELYSLIPEGAMKGIESREKSKNTK